MWCSKPRRNRREMPPPNSLTLKSVVWRGESVGLPWPPRTTVEQRSLCFAVPYVNGRDATAGWPDARVCLNAKKS